MMKIHNSPRPPFARIVMIFAIEAGLVLQFGCIQTVASMKSPNQALREVYPLLTGVVED